MSATLLEGVAVLVVLVVAWQLGIRLAPDIMAALRRARNQLFVSGNGVRPADGRSARKEFHNDTEDYHDA